MNQVWVSESHSATSRPIPGLANHAKPLPSTIGARTAAGTGAPQPTRAEAAAAKAVVEQATKAVEMFTAPGSPLKMRASG